MTQVRSNNDIAEGKERRKTFRHSVMFIEKKNKKQVYHEIFSAEAFVIGDRQKC